MTMHEIQTVIECNENFTTAYLFGAQPIDRRTDQQPPSKKAHSFDEILLGGILRIRLATVSRRCADLRMQEAKKCVLMVGLRGVGKTVLLDRIRADAMRVGFQTMRVEAPEHRSLPAILAPELRLALLELSQYEQARELARRALRGLAGFVGALKDKFADIEVDLDFDPEPGLADNGDLEHDLQALLGVVGEAADKMNTAFIMCIDEM